MDGGGAVADRFRLLPHCSTGITKENHEILYLVTQLAPIGIRAVFFAITTTHSADNMNLISVCLFSAVRVSLFVYMEGSGV